MRLAWRQALRAGLSPIIAVLAAGAAWAAVPPSADAASPYDLPVMLPLTGGAAFVGDGERAGLEALQELVNNAGGIGGRPLHLVFHDDETSPQMAVQLATTILASGTPVLLGSTITAMCNAEAPLMAAGPVMWCYSPGIHPPPGGYVFSAEISTGDLARALIRYFRIKGWTRLGVMTSTDASGQDAERGLDATVKLPENQGVSIVAREHFNPSDVSVAAQIANIKAARPQAFIAWSTGAPVATIFKGLAQEGLRIPVGTTNGNMSNAQMKQYAAFLPAELYIPTGPYTPHAGQFRLDPRVEAAQQAMYRVMAAHHLPIDNQSVTPWDATMIVIEALRHLGTDASAKAVRDYVDRLTDYAGVWGVYDFKAVPQRGIGLDDTVVTRWDPKDERWTWVSRPGGVPLAGP